MTEPKSALEKISELGKNAPAGAWDSVPPASETDENWYARAMRAEARLAEIARMAAPETTEVAELDLLWRVEGLTPCGLREVARFAVEPDAWKYGSSLLMARLYCGGDFRGEYRGSVLPDDRSGGGTWHINKSNDDVAFASDLQWQVWGMSIAGWVILAKLAVEPDALKYAESLIRARLYCGAEFRAEWKGKMRGHPKAAWYDTKLEYYEAVLEGDEG